MRYKEKVLKKYPDAVAKQIEGGWVIMDMFSFAEAGILFSAGTTAREAWKTTYLVHIYPEEAM